jgi:co-chaperonin GroES (HSP10)
MVGGKQEHVWRVLAVGEKVKRGAVGDLILCGQYNGIKIVIGGREIHIISQKEVFAILDV